MGACFSKKKEAAPAAKTEEVIDLDAKVSSGNHSRFYLVEHAVKEGHSEQFWSELMALQSDAAAWAKVTETQTAKGLKGHGFFPISATKIFCTWEVLNGFDEKNLQDYLDSDSVMPTSHAVNACMRVNRNMNPDPQIFTSEVTKHVPFSSEGKNPCFVVKHTVRRDCDGKMAGAWWGQLGKVMGDQDMYKKMLDRHAELKLVNHSFMPLNQNVMICTWEADASVENAAEVLQNYLDKELSNVDGETVLSNHVMQIDTSKNPKPFDRDDSADGTASATTADATDASTEKPSEEDTLGFGTFGSDVRRFFVVEHSALPGKVEEFWNGLTAMMADQEKYAAIVEDQKSKGLIGREFMPTMDPAKAYCTWEVEAGTDDKVLQDYLDNSEMPTNCCTNALIPMSTTMNPDASTFVANSSDAVPASETGENVCFLVKHTIRCDDKHAMRKSWWGQLGAAMGDETMMKGMLDKQAELKMLNHSFAPVNEDFVMCTWEVEKSVENPAEVLQTYLDQTMSNVDGVQTLTNELIRIDTSKNPNVFKRVVAEAA